MDKASARKAGLLAQKSIPDEKRAQYDHQIAEQAIDLFGTYDVIGCYVSMPTEVDTHEILNWCFAHHRRVCVPRTGKHMLVFHEIHSFDDLEEGVMHILEPKKDTPVVSAEEIQVMLVPLVACDEACHRVGHGAGYYDRYLTDSMIKAGMAYPQQKMDSIDTDEKDVDLDLIISCLP